MQLTPEEDAELDALKARLDAGDLKHGSAEFGRMMALARRRRDAIEAERAAAAALLPPPPPPPAPPVPLPDPAKFRARQDRELREMLDLIRSEIAEALGSSPPPSPAVVALEGMEALKAKIDAGRVHPEIAALLSEGETAPDAIERLTPDEDALLDLAASLSDEALGEALRAIPRSAREKWMEGLHGTHADLRLKRGTDKENLHREAQVTRMMTLLGRVGEKR